jgi:holliday junction DNA helicase RuvB
MMQQNDPLRPEKLTEFLGQRELIGHLNIVVKAARSRNEMCEHICFTGAPGLGKTTLAKLLAQELGVALTETSAQILEKPKDIVSLIMSINGPSVLFIDEIHRLGSVVEEQLYSVMEDGELHIKIPGGDGSVHDHIARLDVPALTIVGATTELGMLSQPLRDRFGFIGRLVPYEVQELSQIVLRSAEMIGFRVIEPVADVIASRSRGVPRIANQLLRRVRDWGQVNEIENLSEEQAVAALDAFGIDYLGLDEMGLEMLRVLCQQFNGGPVGLNTLADAIGESASTLSAYEPFLMKLGLLDRTSRGRCATEATYKHLGIEDQNNQQTLLS